MTQSYMHWVNIQDAPHCWHSYWSYSNQPIGYYKESSAWWLPDPKEHKEEQELRGNWLKVCYLLHIIHPQSIFPIFFITFLNSHIDLLDLTKLGSLFQIKEYIRWGHVMRWGRTLCMWDAPACYKTRSHVSKCISGL